MKSEYNLLSQVQETLNFASEVYIVDSTIRSLQSGVAGTGHMAKDLVRIGKELDVFGARELIVNLSWNDGFAVCPAVAAADLKAKLVGAFRARDPSAPKWALDGVAAAAHLPT